MQRSISKRHLKRLAQKEYQKMTGACAASEKVYDEEEEILSDYTKRVGNFEVIYDNLEVKKESERNDQRMTTNSQDNETTSGSDFSGSEMDDVPVVNECSSRGNSRAGSKRSSNIKQQLTKQKEKKGKACCCEKTLEEFEKRLNRKFYDMEGKMNAILRALAEQKVLAGRILGAQRPKQMNLFPIKTEKELREINSSIERNNDELEAYICSIKTILDPAGVRKNLKYILADAIVIEYNVDGVMGKKSLKQEAPYFYEALLESIPFSDAGTPEEQLRKAVQLQKKRFHKKKSSSFV